MINDYSVTCKQFVKYLKVTFFVTRPKQTTTKKAQIILISFKAQGINYCANLGGKLMHYPWMSLWLLLGKQSNKLFVSLDDCGRAGNQLYLICFVKEDGRGNILPPSPV